VALTAAQWNASVRDNFNETAPGKATAAGQIFVANALNSITARASATDAYNGGGTDATNSASYIPLTGGCTITMATGAKAIICSYGVWSMDVAGSRCYISHAVSGATTTAASDLWAIVNDAMVNNRVSTSGITVAWTTLTPGNNTFTQQFKTGSNIVTVPIRRLIGIPF
jgi:hypothetical protein